MAATGSAPGRFIDDRQKYLLFANTCSEKRETARHIGRVIPQLAPRPPAMRLYQVGAGEGTLLTLLLRQIHHHFPRIPVFVVIKENDPDVIRGALRHLADRFNEHPQLVLVLTNMAYPDAGLGPLVAGGGCARCKTLAMAGEASAAFEAQINAALSYVDSAWGPPARRGTAARKGVTGQQDEHVRAQIALLAQNSAGFALLDLTGLHDVVKLPHGQLFERGHSGDDLLEDFGVHCLISRFAISIPRTGRTARILSSAEWDNGTGLW